MKKKKEQRKPLKCSMCGDVIPTPSEGLDYARIAAVLGGKVYCESCEPERAKILKAQARRFGASR